MLGFKLEGVGLPPATPQAWGSDDPDLLGRKTFSAWTDFEFDLCSILESSSIHFGVVYEQILSIFLLNEPVTFLVIEPLYATLRHTQYSYMGANSRKKYLPWQESAELPSFTIFSESKWFVQFILLREIGQGLSALGKLSNSVATLTEILSL